jgi:hypothetical protein
MVCVADDGVMLTTLLHQHAGAPVADEDMARMFELAHVDEQRFYEALRSMGRTYLSQDVRKGWSVDKPTFGYESVVVDWLRHWHIPDAVLHHLYVENHTHRFVRLANGQVIDLCAREFADYFAVDYRQSISRRFHSPMPSHRTRVLAATYGDPERPGNG